MSQSSMHIDIQQSELQEGYGAPPQSDPRVPSVGRKVWHGQSAGVPTSAGGGRGGGGGGAGGWGLGFRAKGRGLRRMRMGVVEMLIEGTRRRMGGLFTRRVSKEVQQLPVKLRQSYDSSAAWRVHGGGGTSSSTSCTIPDCAVGKYSRQLLFSILQDKDNFEV